MNKTKFCDFKTKQTIDETGKLLTDIKTMMSYKGVVYFVNIHSEQSTKTTRKPDYVISIFCEQERIYTYRDGYNRALYEDKDEDFIKEILEHFNLMKFFKGNAC